MYNLENLEFEKNNCLNAIKRKEKIFQPFVEIYKKKIVKLKESVLITSLKTLVEEIKNIGTNNILLINSNKKEFNKLFEKVAIALNFNLILSKIVPGTFTNPTCKTYLQPKAIFIIHDKKEKQAIFEAKKIKIKIIGFNNIAKGIVNYDVCAILNTFDLKSVAYCFWYIITEYKALKNETYESYEDFYNTIND